MRKANTWGQASKAALRILFLAAALFPILWLLITSVKPIQEIITFPVQYLPSHITLENYEKAIRYTDFPLYFSNSIIISLSTAVVTTLLSIYSGYALARFKFRGRRVTLLVFLVTQMIPITVIIIPLFIIFSKLGLINNLLGLVVIYSVLNVPFCTLVIRGFFQRIPVTLEEAAQIDGCSRTQALWRIVLPIMRPGIISSAVFAFIGAWNELFFNTIFITSEANKTVPAGISAFIGRYNIDWGMLSATGILSLIPVAMLFAVIQKFLVSGLTAGAMKE